METKHTKKEWIRQGNTIFCIGEKTLNSGKKVDANLFSCQVSNDNMLLNEEELLANAKLIAAAPELLEALIKLRKWAINKGIDIDGKLIVETDSLINKATK